MQVLFVCKETGRGGQLGGPSSGVPDTADFLATKPRSHRNRKRAPRRLPFRLFTRFFFSIGFVVSSADSTFPLREASVGYSFDSCGPTSLFLTAPEHEGVGFPSSIFGSPTDHLICRSDQSAGILSHDPVVLRGGPLTVDSEDCAAPWPGSLPAVSNAVLSKTPIVVEVGGSSSNTQVSLDASLGHLVGCRLDLSVAPTVVLDPGNPDLLGFRVRVGALCRYLGIFRHGLAVPLRWLCRSRLLDSLLPDSFPLDLVTAIGTSVRASLSICGSLSRLSILPLNRCVPLCSLSS